MNTTIIMKEQSTQFQIDSYQVLLKDVVFDKISVKIIGKKSFLINLV